MMEWLVVFLGGGVGSLARLGMNKALAGWVTDFPVATFLSNLLACLILGFAVGFIAGRAQFSPVAKAAITTGFCGGFSTFSTFGLESVRLMQEGKWLLMGGYVAASVLLCFAGLWLGQWLGRQAA